MWDPTFYGGETPDPLGDKSSGLRSSTAHVTATVTSAVPEETESYRRQTCAAPHCGSNKEMIQEWMASICEKHGILLEACKCVCPFQLYRFPSDPDLKNLWTVLINRANFQPSAASKICGKHFVGGKPTAKHPVPTLFTDEAPSTGNNDLQSISTSTTTTLDDTVHVPPNMGDITTDLTEVDAPTFMQDHFYHSESRQLLQFQRDKDVIPNQDVATFMQDHFYHSESKKLLQFQRDQAAIPNQVLAPDNVEIPMVLNVKPGVMQLYVPTKNNAVDYNPTYNDSQNATTTNTGSRYRSLLDHEVYIKKEPACEISDDVAPNECNNTINIPTSKHVEPIEHNIRPHIEHDDANNIEESIPVNDIVCIKPVDTECHATETIEVEIYLGKSALPGTKYKFVKMERNTGECFQHIVSTYITKTNKTWSDGFNVGPHAVDKTIYVPQTVDDAVYVLSKSMGSAPSSTLTSANASPTNANMSPTNTNMSPTNDNESPSLLDSNSMNSAPSSTHTNANTSPSPLDSNIMASASSCTPANANTPSLLDSNKDCTEEIPKDSCIQTPMGTEDNPMDTDNPKDKEDNPELITAFATDVFLYKYNTIHICPVCMYSSDDFTQMKIHYKIHVGLILFQCARAECRIIFKIRELWLQHMRTVHAGEHLFQCATCKYGCNSSGTLKRHQVTHSNDRPYHCVKCPLSFKTARALQRHSLIHSNVYAFKCTQCKYVAKKQGTLNDHMKTMHSNERPYLCSYCSFNCKRRPSLILHLCTHTGEKRHACPHCPYKSITAQNLRTHMRTHTHQHLRKKRGRKRKQNKTMHNETDDDDNDNNDNDDNDNNVMDDDDNHVMESCVTS